jgi:hypothetical protein
MPLVCVHFRIAMLVSSVPLSETHVLGRPRRAISASSSRATRAPDSEVSGISVDIAKFTERTLLHRWGEGFWILNPALYQLESKAGTGLITAHAQALGIDLDVLRSFCSPTGGDYMRMWTTVLVEDDETLGIESGDTCSYGDSPCGAACATRCAFLPFSRIRFSLRCVR